MWIRRKINSSKWLGLALVMVAVCMGWAGIQRVQPTTNTIVVSSWPDQAAGQQLPTAQPKPTVTPTVTATPANGLPLASGDASIGVNVHRLNQLEPGQYSGSSYDYGTWADSACSAASMTEVINAYDAYYHANNGQQYKIDDILAVEAGKVHEITPQSGLLEPVGIDRTVSYFGFYTRWLTGEPLSRIEAVANSGRPIIIGFPPARWAGGHLLVLTGGDANTVRLVDSSSYNMTSLPMWKFLRYWAGFAVEVLPKGY